MKTKKGFDTELYIARQKKEVINRMKKYDRFYLEFGGHLCYDGHASRVLPGYKPRTKINLIKNLGSAEVIYCVNAQDIESKKRLGDFKLSYTEQTLRDIKEMQKYGLFVSSVVITQYSNKTKVKELIKLLKNKVKNIYASPKIKNYLKGPSYAIKGYDKYPYINVKSKLVVITGAAGGSGKMSVALSQVYKDLQKGINAGYAKFETFPVWNLSLNHPINLAYEAATADLQDKNQIDPYHLKSYGKKVVNYNRDIKNFSILKEIHNIVGKKDIFNYKSPTDMGIGNTKLGIISDKICRQAAIKEIRRRLAIYTEEYNKGRENKNTLNRINVILSRIKN